MTIHPQVSARRGTVQRNLFQLGYRVLHKPYSPPVSRNAPWKTKAIFLFLNLVTGPTFNHASNLILRLPLIFLSP